jgi:ABC-type branched-subunit amino acid transport system substrate-binding protein
VAWEEFVGRYEAAFRRTLDNPYPALGYDAARLILDQLPSGRARRADVARALGRLDGFRGATGVLSTRDGMITRDPFLVRIQAGRPVLAEAPGR